MTLATLFISKHVNASSLALLSVVSMVSTLITNPHSRAVIALVRRKITVSSPSPSQRLMCHFARFFLFVCSIPSPPIHPSPPCSTTGRMVKTGYWQTLHRIMKSTMLGDRVYGQSRGAAQQCDQRREFSIASELAPNPLLLMDSGVPTRIRKDVPECKAGSLASRQLSSGANSPSKKPLVNESCLPRLLDVLGKGTGHDVVHGVHWSDRSMRVADQLRSMSTSTHSSSSHPPSVSHESYPNYDPNLIVTLSGRDFEKFAAVFDQLGSGLNRRISRKGNGANSLTPTSEDDVSLRALPYNGSKAKCCQLRKHFGSLGMMWNSLWLIVIALFSLPAIRGQQYAGQSVQCGPWTTCADIGFPGYCCSQWGVSSLN